MRGLAWTIVLAACVLGSARADPSAASWCGGTLLAERFETEVESPPRGIVRYAVVLRNALDQERRFVLVVTASLFQRPSSEPRDIPPGGTLTVELGYQPWQPGVAPLRGDRLAQVTRVSCIP